MIECWYTENPFTDAIEKSHESEWRHWILHIALGILCIFSVFATLVFFYAIKLKSSSHLTPMLIYNKIELVLHIVTFSCFAIVSVQLLVEDALGKSHDELDISEPVYIEASRENPYIPNSDPAYSEIYKIHRFYKNASTPYHGPVEKRNEFSISNDRELTEGLSILKDKKMDLKAIKDIIAREINYSRVSVVISEKTCLTMVNFVYGLLLLILVFFNNQVAQVYKIYKKDTASRLSDHNIISAVQITGIQTATLPVDIGRKNGTGNVRKSSVIPAVRIPDSTVRSKSEISGKKN